MTADHNINFKLSAEEFQRLNTRCKEAGLTVHNYIRRIALLEEHPLGEEFAVLSPNQIAAVKTEVKKAEKKAKDGDTKTEDKVEQKPDKGSRRRS
jgi:hypothetical protein